MAIGDYVERKKASDYHNEQIKMFHNDNYDPQCSAPSELYKNPELYGFPIKNDNIQTSNDERPYPFSEDEYDGN